MLTFISRRTVGITEHGPCGFHWKTPNAVLRVNAMVIGLRLGFSGAQSRHAHPHSLPKRVGIRVREDD